MKKISNRHVEPFNDIYTHDCFINALLCAAKYYHLDYSLLTLHRGYTYMIHEDRLEGCSVTLFSINELTLSIGLKTVLEKDGFQNWKAQFKTRFALNEMIIASVDDFYNPLRIDTYQKKHLPHYTLIYDMDDESNLLSLIESRYRETVSYKNLEMRYIDFEKSHFQMEKPHWFVCRKIVADTNFPYKRKFWDQCISLTNQSIAHLYNYIQYISFNDIADLEAWLKSLDNICNQIKVEHYVFKTVFCNGEIAGIAAEIYQTWYLLRAKAVRVLMIKQSDNIGLKIVRSLEKILELEKKKLKVLCSHFR